MKKLLVLCPFMLCASCVFVEPKQVVKYDAECDVRYKQYTAYRTTPEEGSLW